MGNHKPYLFHKYFLSTSKVSGIVPGVGDTVVNTVGEKTHGFFPVYQKVISTVEKNYSGKGNRVLRESA